MDAFLFDLGNVILKFDFERAHKRFIDGGACQQKLMSRAMIELRDAYEEGQFDDDVFVNEVIRLSGFRGQSGDLIQAWQEIFELNQPMVELLKQLHSEGRPLYLLSNSNGLHVKYIRENYDILRWFDGIVFSYEAKCIKPNEAIYRIAMDRFKLNPARTAYIDDLEPNIATGRSLGFQTIHYHHDRHHDCLNSLKTWSTPSA